MQRDRWWPAYIGLGSNLDHPARQIDAAFDALAALPASRLESRSGLYRSAPFGGVEQADYVNAAAALLTRLSAPELLSALKSIAGTVSAGGRGLWISICSSMAGT